MRFAFRVDSSPKIGMGHLMRCLTLAIGLRDAGFECYFICRDFEGNGVHHIIEKGFDVEFLSTSGIELDETWLGVPFQQDASETIKVITKNLADWLVVDHYDIDQRWESIVRKEFSSSKVLVIDDLVNRPHDCDILVDQTFGRSAEEYKALVPDNSVFCLGTDHALLRAGFKELRERKSNDDIIKTPHILVTLGGGNSSLPLQIIGRALKDVAHKHIFSVTAITAGTADNLLIDYHALPLDVELIDFSKNIEVEMAKADFVIGAGGGTSWERCCMGLPTVVLTIADNQIEIAKILSEQRAGISVATNAEEIASATEMLISNRELLFEMSENASRLCDGNGVTRVVQEIIASSVSVKLATIDDAQFIYDARYANQASKFYRSQDIPNFDAHVAWLDDALSKDDRILANMFLGENKIAHIRLDREPDRTGEGEIGICLSEDWRGKGLAKIILNAANEHFSNIGFSKIYAEVHENNKPSNQIFKATGYEYLSADSEGFIRYLWQA